MWHSAESIFVVEYLRKFESICKTVLAHESEDPGVQFNEKTEGPKSRETVPLIKKIFGDWRYLLNIINELSELTVEY
jgi:hypothetical protein